MNRDSASVSRLRQGRTWNRWGIALLMAAVAGCGSSDEPRELPEAAKKALVQKKVDVTPRPSPTKPSRR